MTRQQPHQASTAPRSLLRRFIAPAVFVAALFAVTVLRDRPQPATPPELWIFSGPTMGTTFTVKVVAPELSEREQERISDAIATTLEEVDAAMSTWRSDSEVSIFNRADGDPLAVSTPVLTVVAHALEVAERSRGALDITVAPLVRAWGFAREGRGNPPSAQEIAALQARIGWQKLHVDRAAGTLGKAVAELEIDLSAIAKGYAVDRVVESLVALGCDRLMVEIGGEVRTTGRAVNDQAWRIGIETPDRLDRSPMVAIELADLAMATSGDYRNFYELNGQRISHTIDPRSGRPVVHDLASVSVVTASCMAADAWATALNVLGPDEGYELAEQEGLAALFISRADDGFRELATPSFSSLVASPGESISQ